ncbi:MAG: hypothetical protein RL501_361 [Bacteroidota bacterium]
MRVLINDGLEQTAITLLKEAGFTLDLTRVAQEPLIHYINQHQIQGVIVRSATKITAEVIEQCPSLVWIARAGVGLDNIDVTAAQKRQIKVINTPGASAQAVAELAMAHLLSGVRFLHESNRNMPLVGDTEFNLLKSAYLGRELREKTLGIVGFGAIGQSMAKIAMGLGMNVVYCDPEVDEATLSWTIGTKIPVSIHLQGISKDELVAQADFISLHLPHQTKPFLDRDTLARLKPGVGIINTARASAIDHLELLEALNREVVSFAGLDVFDNEPTPMLGLLMHPKISLTPHIGGSTQEAQQRIGLELAEQIIHQFTPKTIDVS